MSANVIAQKLKVNGTNEVNPVIYKLEREGRVHMAYRGGPSGQRPHWSIGKSQRKFTQPSARTPPQKSPMKPPTSQKPYYSRGHHSPQHRGKPSHSHSSLPSRGRGMGLLGMRPPSSTVGKQASKQKSPSVAMETSSISQNNTSPHSSFSLEEGNQDNSVTMVNMDDNIQEDEEDSLETPSDSSLLIDEDGSGNNNNKNNDVNKDVNSNVNTEHRSLLGSDDVSISDEELRRRVFDILKEKHMSMNADTLTKELDLPGVDRRQVMMALKGLEKEEMVVKVKTSFPAEWRINEGDSTNSSPLGSFRDRSPLNCQRRYNSQVSRPINTQPSVQTIHSQTMTTDLATLTTNPTTLTTNLTTMVPLMATTLMTTPSGHEPLSPDPPGYSSFTTHESSAEEDNHEMSKLDEAINRFCVGGSGNHDNSPSKWPDALELNQTVMTPNADITTDQSDMDTNSQFVMGVEVGIASDPMPLQTLLSQSLASMSSVVGDMSRNPISALHEICQKSKLELEFIDVRESGPPHEKTFVVAVKFGQHYFEAEAAQKKEAKRKAADLALQSLQTSLPPDPGDDDSCKPWAAGPHNQSAISSDASFPDRVAALVHDKYSQLSCDLSIAQPGRKVVAGFVMTSPNCPNPTVVAIGTGTRCIEGDKLSLKGTVVHDSHAEVVARRSLMRFMYHQLHSHYQKGESIFVLSSVHPGKLEVREGVEFHLYISTAPCGDGAQFSRGEGDESEREAVPVGHAHCPTMKTKQQGLLRTKMEGGQGTIPIKEGGSIQTWDGIQLGGQLRTMSCSDKVCRWNVVGFQGALLSHLITPVYMSSLILGSLHHHGHLSRAVCCRVGGLVSLPPGYRVNHPHLCGVTGGDQMKRHTEKTNNFSVNWCEGDEGAELIDGGTGRPVSLFTPTTPIGQSRITKSSLFGEFRKVCLLSKREDLMDHTVYKNAKESSEEYNVSKKKLFAELQDKGFGQWMKKPSEVDLFESPQ